MAVFGVAAVSLEASPTRDTTLDHRLPRHIPPSIDLSLYRSVQERPGQNPDIAVAMAISGGGHRAANFAVGVMLGLEAFSTNSAASSILNEIDYFSTVSGGGFAAGVYVSSRYDYIKSGVDTPYSFKNALFADDKRLLVNLERDYQSTLLTSGINPKLFGYKDSGDMVEFQFDEYILGAKYRKGSYSLVLGDMFRLSASEESVVLPYWFANATVYENGARFTFTPAIVEKYRICEYTHRMEDVKQKNGCDLPVALAVKSSASFPVAIPATTFTCADPADPLNDYLHLMDGGLIDNLGVRSAFDALLQDRAPRRILLVVDAYKGSSHPLSKTRTSPCGPQVAYRITKIALDSDHTLLKRNVLRKAAESAVAGRSPIEVLFLSFEDLKPECTEKIDNIQDELEKLRKGRTNALLRRVQREINITLKIKELELNTAKDRYALYNDARAVATSLNISPAEQHLLIRAGREVVNVNRSKLESLISKTR